MNEDFLRAIAEAQERAKTEPIHLIWRTSDGYERRVLCGLSPDDVTTAGAEWIEWRRDPRCCAACLAVYAVRSQPVAWWRIIARLQRRQHVLCIRRNQRTARRALAST